jgi:hypothetical protein
MVALVSVETVLLVLLLVLVAGLLRSQAEILRRLAAAPVSDPAPPPRDDRDVAPAIAGTTLVGDALKVDFEGAGSATTLLAFLTSGCGTCGHFWETLSEPRLPDGVQTMIVTRGAERERPSKLRSLAPASIPVVMSSQAWEDYAVPGSPYFVLVDGAIRGEGVATTWEALSSLVGDAIDDEREAGGEQRASRIDTTLASAGITPGHPSLYPGGQE